SPVGPTRESPPSTEPTSLRDTLIRRVGLTPPLQPPGPRPAPGPHDSLLSRIALPIQEASAQEPSGPAPAGPPAASAPAWRYEPTPPVGGTTPTGPGR